LDELSLYKPDEFMIIIPNNVAFLTAKALEIQKNIGLIFIPPYSPELNQAEKN